MRFYAIMADTIVGIHKYEKARMVRGFKGHLSSNNWFCIIGNGLWNGVV
ncbi:hypothetical protein CDIMF43_310029 [Carnobacterium divergens]|nr:hypothetical protein CDIMF43_310029 [Carnobacterium divergens]